METKIVKARAAQDGGFVVEVPYHNVLLGHSGWTASVLMSGEVSAWLDEYANDWGIVDCDSFLGVALFEFLDEKTAVMFKLRWG